MWRFSSLRTKVDKREPTKKRYSPKKQTLDVRSNPVTNGKSTKKYASNCSCQTPFSVLESGK